MKRLLVLALLTLWIGGPISQVQAQQAVQTRKHAIRVGIRESNGSLSGAGFSYERDLKSPWRLRAGVSLYSRASFEVRNRYYYLDDELDDSRVDYSTQVSLFHLSLGLDFLRISRLSDKLNLYHGPGASLNLSPGSFGRFTNHSNSAKGVGGSLSYSLGAEFALSDRLFIQAQTELFLSASLTTSISDGTYTPDNTNHSSVDRYGASLSTGYSSIGLRYSF